MNKAFKAGILSLVCLLTCFALTVAQAQRAPQKDAPRVMVFPFQVNGGPEVDKLRGELQGMIIQRLSAKGVPVLNADSTAKILEQMKVSSLDLATVRKVASKVGATHAVYGTFTQVGDGYSIDSRLVPVKGDGAGMPIVVESKGMANVVGSVDELADRVAGVAVSRQVLADVQVEGTKTLDPDVVLMRLSVRRGDPIDRATIDREVKKIWELGYFDDVQAELEKQPEGLVLVFKVQEKPRIGSIAVKGNSEMDEDDILAAMSTKTGSILNDKVLVQDLQKITELYRKDGYYLAKVTHSVSAADRGATLIINVDEGRRLYIKDVHVEGASQLSEGDVKDQLALSERGIISWITGSGILREEYLERDIAAINAYYLNNGFLDVRVAAPKVDYQEDGIVITFAVEEGTRYKVNQVTFEGDLIEETGEFKEMTHMDDRDESRDYFSLAVMQDDIKALTDFYSNFGYAFAEIDGYPDKASEDTVNVVYKIVKKDRIFVRRVELEGNVRTRDPVILRDVKLADGDLLQGGALRRSVEKLRKLGYFESADIDIVPTENPEEVDLKVKVKEANTGMLNAGVGYSTYSKIGFGGAIMERNLFGKGYQLSFNGSFSSKYTYYVLSFVNPRLYDTQLGFGVDAYIMRDYYDDFEKKTTGSTLRFFYPLGEYTGVSLGYRFDKYNISDVDNDAASIIKRYEGNNTSSVITASIRRDTTDANKPPRSGTIAYLGVDYGGLGGDDKFVKPVGEFQAFYALSQNHVLHGRVKGGAVLETESGTPVPVFERFYIGGMNSIRGYDSSTLSPRDPASGDLIGGDRMAFANFEYIWVFYPDLGLSIVPFFDIGFNIDSEQSNNWNDNIVKSTGLELRWSSPMGDLRFSYGIPFDKGYDKSVHSGKFEFSMGQNF